MVKVKKEKEELAADSAKEVRFASCSLSSYGNCDSPVQRCSVIGYVVLAISELTIQVLYI